MSYAGDVTPEQAWAALRDEPGAVLVDVRTSAEWSYVGLPDLGEVGKDVVLVEWQSYPDGRVNERFVDELAEAGVDKEQPVYFLCRSGVRSVSAAEAATAAGWAQSRNVLEGFEGPHDAQRHRAVSGWKVAGLPWVQG
ncbi:rhodanese-like domain-containing protein [Intrasporangium sp. YIM S08009]|uniref:rhodanese-like domain-containing protein n=1 Tax=Intrasporangium zincisolvens TaxID=3080018 RepID=UPI002B05E522|nr:rhodanese-like domain-containing protein [Intrasporangium sp. YIM S08009]